MDYYYVSQHSQLESEADAYNVDVNDEHVKPSFNRRDSFSGLVRFVVCISTCVLRRKGFCNVLFLCIVLGSRISPLTILFFCLRKLFVGGISWETSQGILTSSSP